MGTPYNVARDSDIDWWNFALCATYPADMFSVISVGSKSAAGLNRSQVTELNRANANKAIEVCMECPVFVQCEKDATPSDFEYTVRAGRRPMAAPAEMRMCKKGLHVLDGPGRCIPCKKAYAQKHIDNKRKVREDGMTECREGHLYPTGSGRCPECRRIYRRNRRAASRGRSPVVD